MAGTVRNAEISPLSDRSIFIDTPRTFLYIIGEPTVGLCQNGRYRGLRLQGEVMQQSRDAIRLTSCLS